MKWSHSIRPVLMALLSLTALALPVDAGAEPAPAVPVLSWADCGDGFQCATAQVPLDYRRPAGAKISLALIRLPASGPGQRIGSLFVNQGGPGLPGVDFLRQSATLFPAEVRARFDLVAFDPRGVARSTPAVHCFASVDEQQAFFSKLPPFPVGVEEQVQYMASFSEFDALCAARNRELLPHMSTANAARDLDLLRQAIGDPGLSFIGLSAGSLLGNTYAQLFPDRVRALVLDGVVEPVAWTTGSGDQGRKVPFSARINGAETNFRTLNVFLRLCGAAGTASCAFAAGDGTVEKFRRLAARLLEHPVTLTGPGGSTLVTYALMVDAATGALTDPEGWPSLAAWYQQIYEAAFGGSPVSGGSTSTSTSPASVAPPPPAYNNQEDALSAIACVDTDNPRNPLAWPPAARALDERAPYVGDDWTFFSMPCAGWLARDPSRYTGPWNHRTSEPVLVIGNTFDPSTSHDNAVAVSRELPRARLLTLDGYGHTSFHGSRSACIQQAETAYLVSLQLPPPGTVCEPDRLPFGLSAAVR